MSVNSSSFNDPLFRSNHSSINSYINLYIYCLISRPNSFIFTAFTMANMLLLLPLCIFILYSGLQQWWQKHSTSSAAMMSHSDSFTYHMVFIELIGIFGSMLCCCGIYSYQANPLLLGLILMAFTWFGEIFFHILTCVERYLAVVHPITYLRLRKERGVRIRNICIGCVWLLCFAGMNLVMMEDFFNVVNFCLLMLSLTVISFCSLSVLFVLIRPGPGDQGGNRDRVEQSKQRAFYTIVAILVVLVLRFAWGPLWVGLFATSGRRNCVIISFTVWINMPSSLVSPLLFLQRAEKFVFCKKFIK